MGQIDFIMGMVIVLGAISFSLFFISGDFSNDLDQMNVLELKTSASVLENKILNDLQTDLSYSKIGFTNTGDLGLSEDVIITVSSDPPCPACQYFVQVYDQDFNMITYDPLSLTLQGDEKKYYHVFSSGQITDIGFSYIENVTSRATLATNYSVTSEDCIGVDYDLWRDEINHNFKIKLGDRELGLEPSEETVVAKKVPIILYSAMKGKTMSKDFLNIMVW